METGTPISSDFIMFPIHLCGGSNCPLDVSRVIQCEACLDQVSLWGLS